MKGELDILLESMKKLPVDIPQIISDLGIKYKEEAMNDGESGALIYDTNEGEYTIIVNSNEFLQRRRFTAAHELAHYLFHSTLLKENNFRLHRHSDNLFGEASKNNDPSPFDENHEEEANQIAANIIMPKKYLYKHYDKARDNVAELAAKCDISEGAMKIQLATLGLRGSAE